MVVIGLSSLLGYGIVHWSRPIPLGTYPLPELPLFQKTLPLPAPARVAIVLDDWGYNLDAFHILDTIDEPVTLAILPYLPYSKTIARQAAKKGHEVILHVPMEPLGEAPLEKGTLLTAMRDDEIQDRLVSALESLPNEKGVSNHMGSKFSQDGRAMGSVLRTLGSRGLFYLDSRTTHDSVSSSLAEEIPVRVLSRDIFLDNEPGEAEIQARIDDLRRLAKEKGFAIAIGHDEPLTVEMIRRNLRDFEEDGIQLVRLSELLDVVASPQRREKQSQ